jgi:hypothetical protein
MIATVPVHAAAFAGAATITVPNPEMAIADERAATLRRENFFIGIPFEGWISNG